MKSFSKPRKTEKWRERERAKERKIRIKQNRRQNLVPPSAFLQCSVRRRAVWNYHTRPLYCCFSLFSFILHSSFLLQRKKEREKKRERYESLFLSSISQLYHTGRIARLFHSFPLFSPLLHCTLSKK